MNNILLKKEKLKTEIPCVIFAYNRPDRLSAVLEALKSQPVDRLIVFIDGPKTEIDVKPVKRCQELVNSIDWTSVDTHFKKKNLGLVGIIDNIDRVFEQYAAAIFLEDDCFPMPSFISFMRQALVRYETNNNVFSIGGYQPIESRFLKTGSFSVTSSARFLCWGWAGWSEKWQRISPLLPQYTTLAQNLKEPTSPSGQDLVDAAASKAVSSDLTWDIPVAVVSLYLGLIHIVPTRGLIRNDGFDQGVHARNMSVKQAEMHNRNLYWKHIEKIDWPEYLHWDSQYNERLGDFVTEVNRLSQDSKQTRFTSRLIRSMSMRYPKLRTLRDFLPVKTGHDKLRS